jgi:hypothetical protein
VSDFDTASDAHQHRLAGGCGIHGRSVPLTDAMDLVEGNSTPVDFKSAAMPDPSRAVFDHGLS